MSQIDYLNAMGISTWVVKDEDLASNRELTVGSAQHLCNRWVIMNQAYGLL